jgi:hypothetical protein
MNIASFDEREPLNIPSIRCQSLLGKAIHEHFTNPSQIASIFSSSPSLRNSSVGANFLTNFKLDAQSATLFNTVFTPQDCFSTQFAPALSFISFDEDSWKLESECEIENFESQLQNCEVISDFN